MTYEETDECCWCGHSVEIHGTEQIGCRDCSCGMEPDYFHPEPDRPEPWTA